MKQRIVVSSLVARKPWELESGQIAICPKTERLVLHRGTVALFPNYNRTWFARSGATVFNRSRMDDFGNLFKTDK